MMKENVSVVLVQQKRKSLLKTKGWNNLFRKLLLKSPKSYPMILIQQEFFAKSVLNLVDNLAMSKKGIFSQIYSLPMNCFQFCYCVPTVIRMGTFKAKKNVSFCILPGHLKYVWHHSLQKYLNNVV